MVMGVVMVAPAVVVRAVVGMADAMEAAAAVVRAVAAEAATRARAAREEAARCGTVARNLHSRCREYMNRQQSDHLHPDTRCCLKICTCLRTLDVVPRVTGVAMERVVQAPTQATGSPIAPKAPITEALWGDENGRASHPSLSQVASEHPLAHFLCGRHERAAAR